MKQRWGASVGLLFGVVAAIGRSLGADLDSSSNLNGYASIPLGGGAQNVTNNATSRVYDFGDRCADGSRVAVTPAGLDLKGYKLSTTVYTNAIPGDHILLWLNNSVSTPADLTNTGGSGYSFETYDSSQNKVSSGNVSIQAVRDVSIGHVRTYNDNTATSELARNAGSFTIGSNSAPARNVTTGNILTYGAGRVVTAGLVTICATGTVATGTINANGSGTASYASAVTLGSASARAASITVTGDILASNTWNLVLETVASSNDVTLYAAGPVAISGSVDTVQARKSLVRYGNVRVDHAGAFSATNIVTHHLVVAAQPSSATPHWAGSVTLNGDGLGKGASGACVVRDIDASYSNSTLQVRADQYAGDIAISGYTSVQARNLCASNNCGGYSAGGKKAYPGSVAITNIAGDITISGAISLDHVDTQLADDGNLALQCGGTITLASLDLGQVNIARLSAATRNAGANVRIQGALKGFNVSGETRLRCPAGQCVSYDPRNSGNAYLNSGVYVLKDLDGSLTGGRLSPTIHGTTVFFR
jgi:hypothetical protein